MNYAFYDTFSTPFGPFSVAVDDAGALLATAFGGEERLRSRFHVHELIRDHAKTQSVQDAVLAYCANQQPSFTLPLAPIGTAFQQRVWTALRTIPLGQTCSYRDIAQRTNSGPRAVGGAVGRNPIALVIPCHRVIGSNGKLTGFAFGETLKLQLLQHEQALGNSALS